MSDKITDLNKTFSAFQDAVKENNKKRDALLEEKIARLDTALAEKSAEVDALALAANRGESNQAKSAQDTYVRKAFDQGLRYGFDKLDANQRKAMAVGDRNNSDGGFLVPDEIYGSIMRTVFENSPIRQLASVFTTSSSHLEFLQEGSEMGSAWVAEKAPRPETTTPQIDSMKIELFEHYAEPRATRWILEDAAFPLESWIIEKTGERFARQQSIAFMTGNGTTMPKGILSNVSTTVSNASTVKAVVTATAAKVTMADMINLVGDLATPYQAGASILMNRAVTTGIRASTDTTGQYLWQPSTQIGQPNTLLGYPVYQNEDLSGVATGNDAVIFGDFKAGYAIVDKPGSTVTIRDDITEKQYIKFYTRTRVGGGVIRGEALRTLRVK